MEPIQNPIVCAHGDAEKTGRACEHLLKKGSLEYYNSSDHFRFFTGRSTDFVLLCSECAKKPEASENYWKTICDSCVQDLACGTRLGECGFPEIKCREDGLTLTHNTISAVERRGSVISAIPLGIRSNGDWLLLNDHHELAVLRKSGPSACCVTLPFHFNLEPESPWSLAASFDGRFAAVCETYGRKGFVVDLVESRITMELLRGDYQNEHCKFPIAFTQQVDRPLVIHATDWNRLDISDPASGRLLTTREPTSYRRGQDRPAHYLDYFQCGLSVSPSGEWVAGNGWVWHPVGVVTVWNIRAWLTENVWESEDGASRKSVCWRDYYWDGPVCWVDAQTLAVWGLGNDDMLLIPGVRVFDVVKGEEMRAFAGPRGGSKTEVVNSAGRVHAAHGAMGHLVFDRWLYSWAAGKPFSVWDIADGAQLLEEQNFSPLGYHPGSKEFLTIMLDGALCTSRVNQAV